MPLLLIAKFGLVKLRKTISTPESLRVTDHGKHELVVLFVNMLLYW